MPEIAGSDLARTRSRVAVTTRVGTREQREEARRAHAEAKLAAYIKRTIENAPPLSDVTIERLVIMLRGGSR